MPTLGAFLVTRGEPDELLLAFKHGTDDHQHTLAFMLHPSLKINAIGPNADIFPGQ